jgi:type I restriction enzyme S subunit
LQSVFDGCGDGWEEKKLGTIFDFQNGFAFKSKDVVDASNTQLIRMGNLYHNHLDLGRRPVYYPDKFCDTYKKFLLKEGDLIISLTGTTGKQDYGFTVKVPKSDENLLLNQRIAKVIILDEGKTSKDYLLHFLLSKTFLDKLYKTANGTRQANLSTDTIKKIVVRIPKFSEQKSIVTKLDDLSTETKKLEAIYKTKLNHLEELKKSILKKAFNGEL